MDNGLHLEVHQQRVTCQHVRRFAPISTGGRSAAWTHRRHGRGTAASRLRRWSSAGSNDRKRYRPQNWLWPAVRSARWRSVRPLREAGRSRSGFPGPHPRSTPAGTVWRWRSGRVPTSLPGTAARRPPVPSRSHARCSTGRG